MTRTRVDMAVDYFRRRRSFLAGAMLDAILKILTPKETDDYYRAIRALPGDHDDTTRQVSAGTSPSIPTTAPL